MIQTNARGPGLTINVTAESPANPKAWIDLAIVGVWKGHAKGTEQVSADDLRAAKEQFDRDFVANNSTMVIDLDHQGLTSQKTGIIARGVGEISEMRVVGDRLQGRVTWNALGLDLVTNRLYRYISPVLAWNGPDRITGKPVPLQLINATLTNMPFMTELSAVANSLLENAGPNPVRRPNMDLATLAAKWSCTPAEAAARLGIAESATADEIMAALVALAGQATANSTAVAAANSRLAEVEPLKARVALVNSALGLKDDASEVDVQAKLIELRAPSGPPLRVVANALGLAPEATMEMIGSRIAELRDGDQQARAKKLVSNAIELNKKIPPADREWWENSALKNFAATEKVIGSLRPILDPSSSGKAAVTPAVANAALTDGEKVLANSLRCSESEFAADKAEFSRSAELQREFSSVGAFASFRSAERQGRVRIHYGKE